jgi:hypothetical protein
MFIPTLFVLYICNGFVPGQKLHLSLRCVPGMCLLLLVCFLRVFFQFVRVFKTRRRGRIFDEVRLKNWSQRTAAETVAIKLPPRLLLLTSLRLTFYPRVVTYVRFRALRH